MEASRRNTLQRGAILAGCTTALLGALLTSQAAAEPPKSAAGASGRQGRAAPDLRHPTKLTRPSALERFGGEHARRAMRVAQGVPAGRVALRPMFWMTRDHSGAMVALGGRF